MEFHIKKIFVGTMYSGEAEYEKSREMILSQKNVSISHYVVSYKRELEAHRDLFTKWNNERNNFDLFVKVDADTVLKDDSILDSISNKFFINKKLTGMQLFLYDYYTESNILGLTCLSNRVELQFSNNELYPDRGKEIGHDLILRGDDVPEINPAGYHCLYPKKEQAFFYGLHRMLKGQKDILQKTYNSWKKHNDDSRYYALLGACASMHLNSKFSYQDNEFKECFSLYDNKTYHENCEEIHKVFK